MEIKYLQVLVMDNGELLCNGKTVGFVDKLGKYVFTKEEVAKQEELKD
jgi:hypothetical protein